MTDKQLYVQNFMTLTCLQLSDRAIQGGEKTGLSYYPHRYQTSQGEQQIN